MTNNKETQRAELHRTIWNMANDLRGSVDGWDFKQYVLGMLFYRYISENITAEINENEHEAGFKDFDYAKLSDKEAEVIRDDMVNSKGFFILPSELFQNIKNRAMEDENLNETLENIFKNIESSAIGTDSEDNFKGLFDDIDVNSNKLGSTVVKRNEKLVKLINSVAGMNLGSYKDNTIDAFGEALLESVRSVGIRDSKVIGKYRNFDLESSYDSFHNLYKFTLQGKAKHQGEFSVSADSNIQRLDNVLDKMGERLKTLQDKLEATKEQLFTAKVEVEKPFEKATELKEKVLRLAELNRILDMGEVEEKENRSPLLEDVKRVIIDFCNEEYDEENKYEKFDALYPDLRHVGIAYTESEDGRHEIQYELDLESYSWSQLVDGEVISSGSFMEQGDEEVALLGLKRHVESMTFSDMVYCQ